MTSTLELTHEQAIVLRVMKDGWAYEAARIAYYPWSSQFANDCGGLNEAGQQALAEYDAHFTTVERAELERLQNLERKIEAFLGSMRRTKCAIEIGTPEQMWIGFNQNESCWEVNLHEPVDGRYFIEAQSQGDAMRKAFELFKATELEVKS